MKKLIIVDLEKNYTIQRTGCSYLFVNRGSITFKDSHKINFNINNNKKIIKNNKKDLINYFLKIKEMFEHNYNKVNTSELEIFNLRNDKYNYLDKILVFYTSDFYIANADSSWDHTLYRDSTNLGPANGFGSTRADVPDTAFQIAAHFLDTPNTTNATKYEFYVKRIEGSGNLYLNGNGSKSVITAMEIAG